MKLRTLGASVLLLLCAAVLGCDEEELVAPPDLTGTYIVVKENGVDFEIDESPEVRDDGSDCVVQTTARMLALNADQTFAYIETHNSDCGESHEFVAQDVVILSGQFRYVGANGLELSDFGNFIFEYDGQSRLILYFQVPLIWELERI